LAAWLVLVYITTAKNLLYKKLVLALNLNLIYTIYSVEALLVLKQQHTLTT
jgi:hypothetical protein